jgi:hypothetical protein
MSDMSYVQQELSKESDSKRGVELAESTRQPNCRARVSCRIVGDVVGDLRLVCELPLLQIVIFAGKDLASNHRVLHLQMRRHE